LPGRRGARYKSASAEFGRAPQQHQRSRLEPISTSRWQAAWERSPTVRALTVIGSFQERKDRMVLSPEDQKRREKGGATLDEMVAATGWQKHSVRGFMAGALKKKGLIVASEKTDQGRSYRITDEVGQ
jgi:hypothetical protein